MMRKKPHLAPVKKLMINLFGDLLSEYAVWHAYYYRGLLLPTGHMNVKAIDLSDRVNTQVACFPIRKKADF